eukprot:CAMPEP_0198243190 /NCGR_PEP_ID=MMETSP1446-20131203/25326_1 /TAXON_ID=1461542 ORGANISM="Unidentified sp, Strain CCMP2111" /NCGR_SAMPLE_ID=MMETSP1446 /ASSEMBLY_ACC=CAM_ASM_001112 /LENGTH=34 /DNA_ID= /DNA_START= /DNA_END= /DNA_ORIENTATION=
MDVRARAHGHAAQAQALAHALASPPNEGRIGGRL